ncbi:MAG: galactose mutarotase [Lentisphaerae bacterium]|nr:galactose mutarotase [Lentisphaerota bacterium]MCP4102291.1 galactose mutarotase [Lentisphaerota bacterium]
MTTHETFFEGPQGKVSLFKLRNESGFGADITDIGATLVSLYVPDKKGKLRDVVLGYETPVDYLDNSSAYMGATIGRYANRIANGTFEIDGEEYHLPLNDHDNTLHGGFKGFHSFVWKSEIMETAKGNAVKFSRLSPDGEEGFPGNLKVEVTYTVTPDNALRINYSAETDYPTVVNMTNHSYFNLNGAESGDIKGHEVMINSDAYTPVNDLLIPFSVEKSVEGTAFDLRDWTRMGDAFTRLDKGYDNNFVLRSSCRDSHVPAAFVRSAKSGIEVEMFTTEPGMQLYTGFFLNGSINGKGGCKYKQFGGLCLEAQHYPDSPNEPAFPSTLLVPGKKYTQTTTYRFKLS